MPVDFLAELKASAIAPTIAEYATSIHGNETNEIYELLDRKLGRFGRSVPHNFGETLVFSNEDGSVWQAKPSNPIIGANGKPQKYLCPTGAATGPYLPAIAPLARDLYKAPADGSFWDWIEADTSIPIVITEGGKKALSLLSYGMVAIALTGCDGSTVKLSDGTSELDLRLSRFFKGDRTIIIAFDKDRDPRTVSRVSRATDKLASRIAAHNPEAIVRVAEWDCKDGKGADDVIVNRGGGFMRSVIKSAKRLRISPTYLSPTSPDAIYREGKQGPALKEASFIADSITLYLKNGLSWDLETSQLWQYGKIHAGIWSPLQPIEGKELIDRCIKRLLPAESEIGWGDKIVNSVYALLCMRSIGQKIGQPFDPGMRDADGHKLPRLICMRNGVLNSETRELMPHCPSYGHTARLPYDYQPLAAQPQPIMDWLLEMQEGDATRVQALRGFLKCLVTGQASVMQRFLEVIGVGGSGKSVFSSLMVALVGPENVATTSLESIAKAFTSVSFKGKMLIQIPDASYFASSPAIAMIKALSAGDLVEAEQKNVARGLGFISNAMVLITANQPFKCKESATAGDASAIARRRATICFNKEIAREDMNHDLITVGPDYVSGLFAGHIPGLLNWALDMPDEEMIAYVALTDQMCPAINEQRHEVLLAVNPLALWANESLIFGKDFVTSIGNAIKVNVTTADGSISGYLDADTKLYPAYKQWAERAGIQAVSAVRFSADLIQACKSLGYKVEKIRHQNTAALAGVAIGNPDTQPIEEIEELEFEYTEEAVEQLEAVYKGSADLPAQLTNRGASANLDQSTLEISKNGNAQDKDTQAKEAQESASEDPAESAGPVFSEAAKNPARPV